MEQRYEQEINKIICPIYYEIKINENKNNERIKESQ
jgi:hypothetical protein